MSGPTLAQFKAFARDHAELAYSVVMAQAFAQCERQRVRGYLVPLFADFGPFVCQHTGEPITDPDQLYRSGDEAECAAFHAACDTEHRKYGFTGPAGHCPALIADHLRIIAEGELVKAGAKFMGMEDGQPYMLDLRKKFLDLLLGACLKARDERRAA